MLPFVESNYHFKNDFATYKALRQGLYYVDTDKTIGKMAKRLADNTPPVISGVAGYATLEFIRNKMADSEDKIVAMSDEIETSVGAAMECRNELNEAALNTSWRLNYDLAFSAIFAMISAFGFVTKRKLLGLVGLIATSVMMFSFIDELDIRSGELNLQFDRLRDICQSIASSSNDLSLLCQNHNFVYDIMRRRYGRAFTHAEVEDDGEFEEPYDPDATPPTSDAQFV